MHFGMFICSSRARAPAELRWEADWLRRQGQVLGVGQKGSVSMETRYAITSLKVLSDPALNAALNRWAWMTAHAAGPESSASP